MYWIPLCKALVRSVISNCIKCKKVFGLPYPYPNTKQLPGCRTEPSKPFAKVGLDYLGPVEYLRDDQESIGKAYVLLYTCLVTRAAVLRVVPDATTESYLMALRTIFHQVGVPSEVHSDNAAIFKLGAKMTNDDIREGSEIDEIFTCFLASQEIKFIYITPWSPWQGGVYERIIGLLKHQIHKICGDQKLDFFSLQYVVSSAQAMINNRPLVAHARSPNDMITLRPMDFMIPGVMIETPRTPADSPTTSTTETRTRAHLEKFESALERLWTIWTFGVMLILREVSHKHKRCCDLKPEVGDVVIINPNNVSRHRWPLALVVQVNQSKRDGEIRTAVVRCKGKLYKRSVCQLIPLETSRQNIRHGTGPDNDTPANDTNNDTDKDTAGSDQCRSCPTLPTPALLDFENSHLAQEAFPAQILPNIGEEPRDITLDRWKSHDAIGPEIDIFEGPDYDTNNPLFPEDGEDEDRPVEYVDPNTAIPEIAYDHAETRLPHGRTREYLGRKAKAPYINYNHAEITRVLSNPSPPECCRFPVIPQESLNLKDF